MAAPASFVLPDASIFYGIALEPLWVHRYLIATCPSYAKGALTLVKQFSPFRCYTKDDVIVDLVTDGGCSVSDGEKKDYKETKKKRALAYQCTDYFTELRFQKDADGWWYANGEQSSTRIKVPVWSDLDWEFRVPSWRPNSFWESRVMIGKRIPVYTNGAAAHVLPGPAELAPVADALAGIAALYSLNVQFF